MEAVYQHDKTSFMRILPFIDVLKQRLHSDETSLPNFTEFNSKASFRILILDVQIECIIVY